MEQKTIAPALLYGDILAKMIVERSQIDIQYHTNLE